MSYKWIQSLSDQLAAIGCALIQVNMSSSWNQFGFCTLFQDADDLYQLVTYARKTYKYQKIVMIGHSTGCQDLMMYLRLWGGEQADTKLDCAVMISGVSDRDALTCSLKAMIIWKQISPRDFSQLDCSRPL
eukprot:Platyproteum_vivax@DN8395_c0_g1_i1.p2